MLFNSYIFILLFLPLCLIGYFGLNHFGKYTLAQVFLFGMSLWFYGYFNPSYLIIILVSILGNYLFTQAMARTSRPALRKGELILALVLNLGILFYFKYFNFFLQNLNRFAHTDLTLLNITLPLGISFFTFQQIGYVVDAYRGEVAQYPFLQYACFVSYFPQLIAGPIVTHQELIPQFLDPEKKQFQWENFARGLYIFAMGLAKKVLLADVFGKVSGWGFGDVAALDTTNAIFVTLAYTIQIYFDFSGYCDMAIGIGKMMNIDLPLNFDSPYKALTIAEFWQRWHKTLTRFLTKYIYIPLGGNRKGTLRTYVNIMMVFLASGLWHGADYTYILWGFIHGVFSVVNRRWKSWFEKLHPALSWLITFSFINLSMALFRSNSVTDAITLGKRLLAMDFGPISDTIINAFYLPEIALLARHVPGLGILSACPVLMTAVFFAGSMVLILGPKNSYEHMLEFKPRVINLVGISLLLAWCILSFSSVSTFLYFNF
ncbi:MAG: MBOAT family O-acyltransferase [Faecousia sp.]